MWRRIDRAAAFMNPFLVVIVMGLLVLYLTSFVALNVPRGLVHENVDYTETIP